MNYYEVKSLYDTGEKRAILTNKRAALEYMNNEIDICNARIARVNLINRSIIFNGITAAYDSGTIAERFRISAHKAPFTWPEQTALIQKYVISCNSTTRYSLQRIIKSEEGIGLDFADFIYFSEIEDVTTAIYFYEGLDTAAREKLFFYLRICLE